MKIYQCDSCKKAITDPYKVKMKEFFVGTHFDYGMAFPEDSTQKVKIHLCDDCYRGLCLIAEKKRSDNDAENTKKLHLNKKVCKSRYR